MLLLGVNHEHCVRQLLHGLDTAVALLEIKDFLLHCGNFLLRKQIERAVLLHLVEVVQTVDRLLDGLEVGHHTAGPTHVDIVHSATGSLFLDGFRRLLLRTHKQQRSALFGQLADEVIRLVELFHGFLQVDNINTVPLRENVLLHFRVPSSGVVSEMNTCFKQLLDRDNRHVSCPPSVFPPSRRIRRNRTARYGTEAIFVRCVYYFCAADAKRRQSGTITLNYTIFRRLFQSVFTRFYILLTFVLTKQPSSAAFSAAETA